MTSSYQVGSEEMVGNGEGEAKQPAHKRSVHPVPEKHLLKHLWAQSIGIRQPPKRILSSECVCVFFFLVWRFGYHLVYGQDGPIMSYVITSVDRDISQIHSVLYIVKCCE